MNEEHQCCECVDNFTKRTEGMMNLCVKAVKMSNALKLAWGSHYPAGMTELFEFDKAVDEYKKMREKP